MMVHYGAPPDFRRGRDTREVVRRVEEAERLLRTLPFRGPGLHTPALDALRAGLVLDFAIPGLVLP